MAGFKITETLLRADAILNIHVVKGNVSLYWRPNASFKDDLARMSEANDHEIRIEFDRSSK